MSIPSHRIILISLLPSVPPLNYDKKVSVSLSRHWSRNSPPTSRLEFEVDQYWSLSLPQPGRLSRPLRNVRTSTACAKKDFSTYEGNCFLGIDAGSTTTKAALVGEDGSLLYSFYSSNNGSPLKTAIRASPGNLFPDCRIPPGLSTPAPPATARR